MTSDRSKAELKRRRAEQVKHAQASIVDLKDRLATKRYYAHSRTFKHFRRYEPSVRCTCSDDELQIELETTLANMEEHLKRWSQPFEFELEVAMLPKAVTRAIRKLRKRTRRMLMTPLVDEVFDWAKRKKET